jgi:hypothetical protein
MSGVASKKTCRVFDISNVDYYTALVSEAKRRDCGELFKKCVGYVNGKDHGSR